MTQSVSIAGLEISAFKSISEAAASIVTKQRVNPGFAVAINPEKIITALQNPEVYKVLQAATLRYPDGIGVVKSMRKKGMNSSRIPGCELWLELMKQCASNNTPVAIIGASPEVNRKTVEKLSQHGVNIVFAQDGFFRDEEQLIEQLVKSQAKVISVALGSPKQEQLIIRLQRHHRNAFYMGVGGSYDVYVGKVKRAPILFRRCKLEWFYRLCSQPTRLTRQLSLGKYLLMHVRGKL